MRAPPIAPSTVSDPNPLESYKANVRAVLFFHLNGTMTGLPHHTMEPWCDVHLPDMLVALRLGKGRVRQGGGEGGNQPTSQPASPPLNQRLRLQTSLDFNRSGSGVWPQSCLASLAPMSAQGVRRVQTCLMLKLPTTLVL